MDFFFSLISEVYVQAAKAITGRLFTESQIKSITRHSVGRYFKELFPEAENEIERRERIELAQNHITQASRIMSEMRSELDAQKETLELLLAEVDEKKSTAERYDALAKTNQRSVTAMREEIEATLREELTRQSKAGRGTRRIASAFIWLFTLVAGAVVGNHYNDIIAFFKGLFN